MVEGVKNHSTQPVMTDDQAISRPNYIVRNSNNSKCRLYIRAVATAPEKTATEKVKFSEL